MACLLAVVLDEHLESAKASERFSRLVGLVQVIIWKEWDWQGCLEIDEFNNLPVIGQVGQDKWAQRNLCKGQHRY